MFLYDQISGSLWHRTTTLVPWVRLGLGYAGNGDGINNPAWQGVQNHGPLPRGKYALVPVIEPHKGPIVFRLDPYGTNEMLGRFGFMLHWDNANHNMTASEGCMCFRDLQIFQFVQAHVASGDNQIEVVAMPPLLTIPGGSPNASL